MPFYLIRHAQPLIAPNRCYGRSDIPAVAVTAAEISALQAQLPPQQNLQFFSSPLQRCAQLAQQLANGRPVNYSPGLQELDFGAWELQPWAQIPRAALDAWASDLQHFAPPGGESFAQLCKRVGQFIQQCDPRAANILVTHSGVIKVFYHLLHGHTCEEVASRQIPYLSLSIFNQPSTASNL